MDTTMKPSMATPTPTVSVSPSSTVSPTENARMTGKVHEKAERATRALYWTIAIAVVIVAALFYSMREQRQAANTSNFSGKTVATPANTAPAPTNPAGTDENTGSANGVSATRTDTTTDTTTTTSGQQ